MDPELHARLTRSGIDPDLARLCRRCRQPRHITGYEHGRLSWVCQTPSCLAVGSPHLVSSITIQATCAPCGDPGEHRLAELSNGEMVATCHGCHTVTIMSPLP
jgi:hypothetical protein